MKTIIILITLMLFLIPQLALAQLCVDDDGGKNYFVKGNIVGKVTESHTDTSTQTDYCHDEDTVLEYFCVSADVYDPEWHTCPNGCDDGACIGNPSDPCTERWGCPPPTGLFRGYLNADCTWSDTQYCENGCYGGYCSTYNKVQVTNDAESDQEAVLIKRNNGDLVIISNSRSSEHGSALFSSISKTNGMTWSEKIFVINSWDDLSIIEENNNLLLLAQAFGEGLGVWKSSDAVTWQYMNKVFPTTTNDAVGDILKGNDGYYYVTYNHENDVYLTRSSDLVYWHPAVQITSGVEPEFDSSIIQLPSGEFFIVFNSYTDNGISFSRSTDGTTWTAPELAVSTSTGAHIGLNAIELNSKPYLFYGYSREIFYSYFNGNEWSAPVKILNDPLFGADVTIMSSKDLGLAFTEEPGGQRDTFFKIIESPEETCYDFDGGENYFIKGTVSSVSNDYDDRCTGDLVIEYTCENNDYLLNTYECPNGCEDGACVWDNCTKDSADVDFLEAGTVTLFKNGQVTYREDNCLLDGRLQEVFCCSCFRPGEDYLGCQDVCAQYNTCTCVDGACVEETCTDSDGGIDYYTKGTATSSVEGGYDELTDFCAGGGGADIRMLAEAYCSESNTVLRENYICPNGCDDGACIPYCDDSDGGKDYYIKGKAERFGEVTEGYSSLEDFCAGGGGADIRMLAEAYCTDEEFVYRENYICPNGCDDGACIEEECYDNDNDGYTTCDNDCDDSNSAINPGASEICNGIDDDCDGSVDDGLTCLCYDGDTRPCGTDVGECETGISTCRNGLWDDCEGADWGSEEICSGGLDEDCDGDVDGDDSDCVDVVCDFYYQDVFEGGEGPRQISIDEVIHEVELSFVTSDGQAYVIVDGEGDSFREGDIGILSGIDIYMKHVWPISNTLGRAEISFGEKVDCGTDVGVCVSGVQLCTGDNEGNVFWTECIGSIEPSEEVCDGQDNDCDGTIDEDCVSCSDTDGGKNYEEKGSCTSCSGGGCGGSSDACIEQDGVLMLLELYCENNECNTEAYECPYGCEDGACLDPECNEGDEMICGTDIGVCEQGMQTCQNGIWSECAGGKQPVEEICYNKLDDDCDYYTDEGCIDYIRLNYVSSFYFKNFKIGESIPIYGTIYTYNPNQDAEDFFNELDAQLRIHNPEDIRTTVNLDKECKVTSEASGRFECTFSGEYTPEIPGDHVTEGVPNENVINYQPNDYSGSRVRMEDFAYKTNGEFDFILKNPDDAIEMTLNKLTLSHISLDEDILWEPEIQLSPGETYTALASETGFILPEANLHDAYTLTLRYEYDESGSTNRIAYGHAKGSVMDTGYVLGGEKSYPKLYILNTSFNAYDPAILDDIFITEDIGEYDFILADIVPAYSPDSVIEAGYGAVYQKDGEYNFSLILYDFVSEESCSEFIEGGLSTTPSEVIDRSFDGLTVYELIQKGYWHDPETGDIVEMERSLFVWKDGEYFVAVQTPISLEDLEDPIPLIEAYLEKYPSDLEVFCGNNICDGDEDLETCPGDCGECSPGDIQKCGTDIGACESGEQECIDYLWGECDDIGPVDEICWDELDNDCDFFVDENCDENTVNANLWLDKTIVTVGGDLIVSASASDSYGFRLEGADLTVTIEPGGLVQEGETDENGIWTDIIKANLDPGEYTITLEVSYQGLMDGSDEESFSVTSSITPVDPNQDATFVNMAQISVKMETIKISLTEVQKVIKSIINYYTITGNPRVVETWEDISGRTDDLIEEIDIVKSMISDFMSDPDEDKITNIKEKIKEVSDIIRALVDDIVSVG